MDVSWQNILTVAQIIVLVAGIGVIYGVLNTKLSYMEKKLDKHNNFIERLYRVEANAEAMWRKLKEICEERNV